MITRIFATGILLVVMMMSVSAQSTAVPYSTLQPWTCNGATGTVDETAYDLTQYLNGAVFLNDWAADGSVAVIRYNITATTGLWKGMTTEFRARVLDNGPQSRVILYVRRYNLSTGAITTLGQIDSDNYSASSGFQVMRAYIGNCNSAMIVSDFDNYSYYVEAHLMRTGWGGNPGLGLLWMKNMGC
ncbi:MAG: hypothetical protein JNM09_20575 [Blastocatellia bacterium]|nr:hypothetical protein [Blastocatellia bacterium]